MISLRPIQRYASREIKGQMTTNNEIQKEEQADSVSLLSAITATDTSAINNMYSDMKPET